MTGIPLMGINQNFQMKVVYIYDNTTYSPVGQGGDPTVDTASASYIFTPSTSDNVILGILWRCQLKTGAANSRSIAQLRFPYPTDLTGDHTDTYVYSACFGAGDNNTTQTTQYMWVSLSNEQTTAGVWGSNYNKPLWGGQSSYTITLMTGARTTNTDQILNPKLYIYYIDKSTKGSATLAKV